MLLYIIRHGEPDYTTDTLTPRGILQAEAVGKRLAASGIDEVYSSPLGRAKETAAPLCRILGLDCHIEPWSEELDGQMLTEFPDGVSKSVSLVQNTYYRENGNIALPYEQGYEAPGFNISGMKEKVAEIEANGRAFLERLGYKEENGVYKILWPNEEKVALFCHGAFGRAWLSTLLRIPIHMMWSSFGYTHTGVTIVEFANNENGITAPRCLCFSDISHLYAEGLDMVYDNYTTEL